MNSTLEHNLTQKAPKLKLEETKRVKILATVGPATSSPEMIAEMFEAGVDGFRLNFSHGTHAEKVRQIELIRKTSLKTGKPVAIVQDLHGPKIALCKFEDQPVDLINQSSWELVYKGNLSLDKKTLPLEFDLSTCAKVGEPLYIADGRIKTVITAVNPSSHSVKIEVINGGLVTSGKGLNLPDTDFSGSVITEKDIEDVKFGADKGFDYVALSFVQKAEDVFFFKNLLANSGSQAKVISKIETKSAVANLDKIVAASDGVMVARGDLATEVGPESVPVLQRKITGVCIEQKKICIVATQMLASMVTSPEPTRAEVSDIATAVIVGADCVMLSEETAIGNYPIEAISSMKRVILYTQTNSNVKAVFQNDSHQETIAEAIAAAVIELGNIVSARALVIETRTGKTALSISAHRPERTIIAVTSEPVTAQQLAIAYGTKSFIRPIDPQAATKLTNWLKRGEVLASGDVVVTASGKYPGQIGGTDTIKVRLIE